MGTYDPSTLQLLLGPGESVNTLSANELDARFNYYNMTMTTPWLTAVTTQSPATNGHGSLSLLETAGEMIGGALGGSAGAMLGGAAGSWLSGGSNGGVVDIFTGPGVPEPRNELVKKRWENRVYSNTYGYIKINYYHLNDLAGKYRNMVLYYNNATRTWGSYRLKKNVVISSNPRMSDLRKLERLYDKNIRKLAKKSKALKLAK